MTPLSLIADCICSGQVPDWQVPGLVLQTPGLAAELNRRSRATSPVLTGEAGRGDSVLPHQTAFRPADPFNLRRDGALAHRLPEEKGGGLLKTRRLVFQFIRSLHPPSFLRKLMRK